MYLLGEKVKIYKDFNMKEDEIICRGMFKQLNNDGSAEIVEDNGNNTPIFSGKMRLDA
jgi:hypothetical protein